MSKPKTLPVDAPKRVPYVFSPDWTGITAGLNNAYCSCTRARRTLDSPEEIKRIDRACIIHGGMLHG